MKEQANPRIDLTGVPTSTHSGPRPAPSGSFSEALGKVSQSYIRIPGGERRSVPGNFVGANQIGLPQALASSHETILQDLGTSIVESSDDAIISKDLDGIITSWNWGAEQLFGYTADEVIGKPVTILIPAERQEEEPEILARIRRGERIGHYETVRRRKDGSFVDISLTVSPIYGSDGEIIGASKIARDITDRKRAEEKISLLAREAEHRARNVLATVQAVVHLSQADTPADLKAAIKGRIQALANVHTLFVESHWKAPSQDFGCLFLLDEEVAARRDLLTYPTTRMVALKNLPQESPALAEYDKIGLTILWVSRSTMNEKANTLARHKVMPSVLRPERLNPAQFGVRVDRANHHLFQPRFFMSREQAGGKCSFATGPTAPKTFRCDTFLVHHNVVEIAKGILHAFECPHEFLSPL